MPVISLGSDAMRKMALVSFCLRNLQLSVVMTQSKVGSGGLDNQKIELFPYVHVLSSVP